MQYDEKGVLRPCAFYSCKNNPAECNYPIYDKEMLAIIKCLREWDAELRSVGRFAIITDHRNLEYFMTVRRLSERQIRWSITLSQYDFVITYRPGKANVQADALSRREQDLPCSPRDERLQHRYGQLLYPGEDGYVPSASSVRLGAVNDDQDEAADDAISEASDDSSSDEPGSFDDANSTPSNTSADAPTNGLDDSTPDTLEEDGIVVGTPPGDRIKELWAQALTSDRDYSRIKRAIQEGERQFPTGLDEAVRVSMSDCTVDEEGFVLYRNRRWVPNSELLRTAIIQQLHDSSITMHPGKNLMIGLVARQFFWPNYVEYVRRFVRNCDVCGRSIIWRDRKQGLLRPLPIPDRQWREIAMDFVGPLPASYGYKWICVITD